MIRTHGAFLRDPLYNNLQLRNVKVEADVTYLLSPKEIEEKTAGQLQQTLEQAFSFDNFREQQVNNIAVTEEFRADYLNRVLYKCPHCMTEGEMLGKGVILQCRHCGKEYELTEQGYLTAKDGETAFTHIPDWYRWQRDEVVKEIQDGNYHMDIDVDICVLKNLKCIYRVGDGTLHHDGNGFRLEGCGGKLQYTQKPQLSYSLYADYYWYEIGDVICIGDMNQLYYCFPKNTEKDVAAKARIATEELYKIIKHRK